MDVAQLRNSFVSGMTKFGQNIAQTASWCGRKISYGFKTHIVPAAKKVSEFCAPYIKKGAAGVGNALRSGWGIAVLLGITALAINEGAEQILSDTKPRKIARRCLHTLAIGCAVAATYFAVKFNSNRVF